MQYRDFQDEKLSVYAMGCMRLPVVDGDDNQIDEPAAAQMIDYAYQNGVNYFDTAWGYHGGNSELVVGRALSRYPRDTFNLADKFPGYDLSNFGKVEEIFEKQLEKCQVDHFDFYLAHNVCELNIDSYLDDERFHTISYLLEQKKAGRIRHLGFSVHGDLEVFNRFLDAYGQHMEFCQIQLNYLDWEFQNAKAKVEALRERNIPVWVMEPVRGGQLCKLPEKAQAVFAELNAEREPVEWALRWLLTVPEVTTILSGASTLAQMKQNIEILDRPALCEKGQVAVAKVAEIMQEGNVVPCTACHYCTSHCPLELDIPRLLALYNEHKLTNGGFIAPMALSSMPDDKQPASCIGCGSCAAVCPQQIDIPGSLADFAQMLKK